MNINIKETVHEFLKDKTEPMTAADISKVIGYDTISISKALYSLTKTDGLLIKSICPDTGKNQYLIKTVTVDPEPETMTEELAKYAIDDSLALEFALQTLEKRINHPTPTIENVSQKIEVLTRLSDLLDVSIANVLHDIIQDIDTFTRA